MPLSFLFDSVGTGEDKENARNMKKCEDERKETPIYRD